MTITFYGAAQMVTGSKHLLTLENSTRILLDCGLFQGKGSQTKELNQEFGFQPSMVNYLVLSHAHVDHCGLIPKLVREGFAGKILCTPPTLELCELLMLDSARIQQSSEDIDESLYTEEDARESLKLFETVPYNKKYKIEDGVELLFTDAGHVLGSAAVNLTVKEEGKTTRLCFSGDIGRFANRILKAPQPFPQADVIICESTYGHKFHLGAEGSEDRLEQIVKETCVERGGKLLIPAFSVGRTQELIYSLNRLAETGRLGQIKVFVDSPMSVYATQIIKSHPECFNDELKEYMRFEDPDPFGFKHLHFVVEADDSKLIHLVDEPCIIIASSGMMEAGRIRHHLKQHISDSRNTVLVTGYCEPSTLGGKLVAGAQRVNIMGEECEVKADVLEMKEYSAHADFGDIAKFLICQDKEQIGKIFLVHGEKEGMLKLKEDLEGLGYANIELARFRMSYEL
jgi:metallo-beta-lactamase family protein